MSDQKVIPNKIAKVPESHCHHRYHHQCSRRHPHLSRHRCCALSCFSSLQIFGHACHFRSRYH
ncbi:hypothetical protein Hanom_Chr14g01316011 [Helianthus anomalus]